MGEIAEVISGGTPRTSDASNFEAGDIPWLTPADLSGYTEKYVTRGARSITSKGLASSSAKLVPTGSVLFTSRAPIGYVAIAKNPIATNQGFKNFVLKDGVLPEYVYWWLKGAKQAAEKLASGTTFLEISGTNAKKLPIPIVGLERQKEIVAEIEKQFSRLDEAVANLKRVKANLKRYKAAVLKAAVEGRLVPTEAELARKEGRDYTTGEQLLKRILETRREEWKGKAKYKEPSPREANEFAALPDGWTWCTVNQLVGHLTDGDHQAPPQTDDGVPFLVISNVKSGELDFSNSRFVGKTYYDSLDQSRQPMLGDLLYTLVGSYGIPVCVKTKTPFCIQRHIAILRPHSQSPMDYLAIAMASDAVFKQASNVATGTAQMTVPLAGLRMIAIPLPPRPEQDRIVAEIDRRLSIAREIELVVEMNLKRAQSLREATLASLFSKRGPI